MEALLILGGVVVFLCAWVWLAVASRAMSVGLFVVALVAPVLTLVLRRKGYSRPARLLLLLGIVISLSGLGLLYREQPEQFDQLVSGRWVEQPADSALSGTLMEQPFVPNDVRWQGNHLIFSEKAGERTRRSLVVKFDRAEALLQGTAIDLLPGDAGPWPELVLQWYTGALEPPGLRRLDSAYSMSLSLAAQGDEQTQMIVHLHLPAEYGTRLSGSVLLNSQPEWFGKSAAVPAAVEQAPQLPQAPVISLDWQEISLLALLDEPRVFVGQAVRLTTTSGKEFVGVLKAVTAEKRVVLAMPQGANQVDFQFHPVDIQRLETRPRR
ncbi:MAG: hypothetical protein ACKVK5_10230 [Pseudomonadales bacterium]|tara:strand:- start:11159 stop:12130 length:972 start_codon:yes stop_codon:yes gene_type:complete